MNNHVVQESDFEILTMGIVSEDLNEQENIRQSCLSGQVQCHVYVHTSILHSVGRKVKIEMLRPKIGDWRYQWAKTLLEKDPSHQLPQGFAQLDFAGNKRNKLLARDGTPNKGNRSYETDEY
ncbi:hypothetical protein AB6D11_00230 [Vibrio splendidus]